MLIFSVYGFFGDPFPIIPGDLSHPAGTLKLSFDPLIFKLSASAMEVSLCWQPCCALDSPFLRGGGEAERGEGGRREGEGE